MTRRTVAAAVALAAVTIAGCSSSGGGSSLPDGYTNAVTYLRQFDEAASMNGHVPPAYQYRVSLDQLNSECKQNLDEVAVIVHNTLMDEVHHNTAESSNLVVMNHLIAAIPAAAVPTDCAQIAAAYLVLEESGK